MIIDVITIFPKMFSPVLDESIIKRARIKGLVKINLHNLRDYSDDRHKKIDAPSYGGGGMVFRPEPCFKAVDDIVGYSRNRSLQRIILFSPQGKVLNQKRLKKFLNYERLVILAPRYEGVDERVMTQIDEEISIGDFILTGGEIPAAAIADSIVRLLPGVLKKEEATEEESFFSVSLDELKKAVGETEILKNISTSTVQLLEYPHYTRPEEYEGKKVPDILISGNHEKIRTWRLQQAYAQTKKKRPDLLAMKSKE